MYLDLFLPLYSPTNLTCYGAECESALVHVSGSGFTYDKFMTDLFDRTDDKLQYIRSKRCYMLRLVGEDPTVVPVSCAEHLDLVCVSRCPPSTAPMGPSPIFLQESEPLDLSLIHI